MIKLLKLLSIIRICIVTGCLIAPLIAQEDSAKDKKKVSISLLAVGDLPPIKYQATAHGPVFIEPPKEDFPPPMVYVANKASKDGFDKINLGLNTPMPPVEHPGGKVMKIYQDKGDAVATEAENDAKECYVKVPLPDEKVDLTVFLVRNPGTKSWRSAPKSIAFKNDSVSFPADCVRAINFSSYPVKASIAGVVFNLGPYGSESSIKVVQAACKDNVLQYQLAGAVKGTPVVLANTATSFYQGTRLNLVVYDGDSKDFAGKIRLCTFVELPIQKPAVKKEAAAAGSGTTAAATTAP